MADINFKKPLQLGIFSPFLSVQLKQRKVKFDKQIIDEMEREYYKKYFHSRNVKVFKEFRKKWWNKLADYLETVNERRDF